MSALWKRLSASPKEERPPRFSQNGTKFRSICSTCNNIRLGAECDPFLIDFTTKVARLLSQIQSTRIILPPLFEVTTQPLVVLRAIVGHALALNVGRGPRGPLEETMAEFFLNPAKPVHRAFDCFYWLYPYNDQVFVDAAVLTHSLGSGRGGTYFKLLKFYPLAFMLTWEHQGHVHYDLQNLCNYRRLDYTGEVGVVIETSKPPHQLWPECPMGTSAVLYGGSPRLVEPRAGSSKCFAE